MDAIKVIEVKEDVRAHNGRAADALRARLREQGLLLVNLMSSPGAGKTTLLSATLDALAGELAFGVMEADVDSAVDAEAVAAHGARAIQLHTGGMCHLDAAMSEQGLRELGTDALDIVVIENVGNLICPAEFDTGAAAKVMLLSTPEGHDKPLKYPLMFEVSDLVLLTKVDVAEHFDFDQRAFEENVRLRNPGATILPVSAKTGQGMEAWYDWLRTTLRTWRNSR